MNRVKSFLAYLLAAVLCVIVNTYPSGVPLSRCGNMTPKHKGATPLSDSPYYITAVRSGDFFNGNF